MDIKKFPNPKLNLPKEFKDLGDKTVNISFKAVENYLGLVSEYIYTNINQNYERSNPNHIHSWIQRIISANVLRSLYLRNAFVEEFNARNIVGIFLPLKAWFETVGVLASILNLLEKNLSANDLFKKLEPYTLGNKGKGSLRVGRVDAINVITMMENADEYIKKMVKESKISSKEEDANNFFTDFYDVVSNPSHPSFDAYELIGVLQEGGIWKAKNSDEIKNQIIEDVNGYGPILMSPFYIKNICEKLFKIEAQYFDKLKSQKYFN